jgi:hypothetical protein
MWTNPGNISIGHKYMNVELELIRAIPRKRVHKWDLRCSATDSMNLQGPSISFLYGSLYDILSS